MLHVLLIVAASASGAPSPTPTPIVITDDTLAEVASRGRLATSDAGTTSTAPTPDLAPLLEGYGERQRLRTEWRRRLAAQLAEIRRLAKEVEEQRVAAGWLWIRYLRTEKEFTRERKVRPRMEAARAKLAELEAELDAARTANDRLREAARRAGAEPGWFRNLEEPDR